MSKHRFYGDYYADLNPRFGQKGETRWAIFHRRAGMLPNSHWGYTSRKSAERAAERFSIAERFQKSINPRRRA